MNTLPDVYFVSHVPMFVICVKQHDVVATSQFASFR